MATQGSVLCSALGLVLMSKQLDNFWSIIISGQLYCSYIACVWKTQSSTMSQTIMMVQKKLYFTRSLTILTRHCDS